MKWTIDAVEIFAAVIIIAALTVIVMAACAMAYPLRLLLEWKATKTDLES